MMAIEHTKLKSDILVNEPMSRHCSWRVGGTAERFYRPTDIDDLALFLSQLDKDEPLTWIGLGSNLLIRDGGIKGTVICLSGALNDFVEETNERVYVGAGLASPQVARKTARLGLTGAEFLCGIPGTVGGALAMNAGAMGGETWDIVESVTMIDRNGTLTVHVPSAFEVSYRHVKFDPEKWFVGATLKLSTGDKEQSLEKIKHHLARRASTQPTQQPNAGSVFRNPQGDYAARLIESCGLKNTCVGGACVSEKHANFIINTGTATAKDIETLIETVQDTVKKECDVSLIREVQIIGVNPGD